MRQLLIIRHAQSDWGGPELEDFNRPLNQTGNTDASKMAERLVEKQLLPQLLISSPALRAIDTAKHFADALKIGHKEIKKNAAIYEASAADLLYVINHLDDRFGFAALFGHNPGITDLLINLCGPNIYNLPPCGMCLVTFPFDSWKLISSGTGEMKFFEYPEEA